MQPPVEDRKDENIDDDDDEAKSDVVGSPWISYENDKHPYKHDDYTAKSDVNDSPGNIAVADGTQHHKDGDGVEEAVATERPPVEMRDGAGAERADGDHEHYVEHSRTDHAGYTWI